MTKQISLIKAGVIGCPIKHSKSPTIHQHWIEQHNLKADYKPIEVLPENLERDVASMVEQGYVGFNVTSPHKQNIFLLCHEVDNTARSIGAVNTVLIREGRLIGTNTDAFGYIENLKQHEKNFKKDRPVLVLGAGGAARAVVYGLLIEGFRNIIIANRTMEKAAEVAQIDKSHTTCLPWDKKEDVMSEIGLLINTTSLGLGGNDPLEISIDGLPRDAIVSDIVYSPLMTPLLMTAQKRGNPVSTGIGMLLHQARPAFHQWFGIMPDINKALQDKVLA